MCHPVKNNICLIKQHHCQNCIKMKVKYNSSVSTHILIKILFNRLTANRKSRQDFPTPESPISKSLNR